MFQLQASVSCAGAPTLGIYIVEVVRDIANFIGGMARLSAAIIIDLSFRRLVAGFGDRLGNIGFVVLNFAEGLACVVMRAAA